MSWRVCMALLAAVVLGGCASLQRPPVEPDPAERYAARQARLQSLAGWRLYARAAIQTPSESGTVSLFWRQGRERYTLTLRAALGAGTVELRGGPDGVTLRSSGGHRDSAASAAVLVRRHTGYTLPVERLRYWVLGLPAPGARRSLSLNRNGEVEAFRQAGWTLHYDHYRSAGELRMPGTIRASGQGVELKLAVQQWELNTGGVQ